MQDIKFEEEAVSEGQSALPKPATTVIGRPLGVALILGAIGLMAWGWWRDHNRMTQADVKEEEFRTARADVEFNWREPANRSENRLRIEAPSQTAEKPATAAPASQNFVKQDDEEARRRAEEERRRQEAERRRLEAERLAREAEAKRMAALRSNMLILDSAEKNSAGGPDGAVKVTENKEEDANRRFLDMASMRDVETSRPVKHERIDALIPQGYFIRGALETAIQSDLPGMVRATVSEDVYSFDGRRVLIPQGTMLTGEYKSGLARGQTRVMIVWTRLMRSDGVSMMLGSQGTDDLGRAGLTGEVDEHYVERFGGAVMLTMLGGVAQFVGNLGQNQNNNQNNQSYLLDPATGQAIPVSTSGSSSQTTAQARSIGGQVIAQSITQLASEALKDSVHIPPTLHVDQGTPIIVFVRRDLDFSSLYPDPVKEALRELKREASQR